MSDREQRSTKRAAAGLATVALLAVAGVAAAGSRVDVKEPLKATSADGDARGSARFSLRGAHGKFDVTASRLDRDASYDVVVGGIKVGTLDSNASGRGRVRFRSRPSDNARLLGFDPRGSQVSLRSVDGKDVLVGEISPDTIDPTHVACCLPSNDGGSECEDETPDACTAAGGTPSQAATCIPGPCGGASPSADAIVCCVNQTHDDGSEAECESDDEAQCAALGGTVVQATACDPNPCAPAPAGDVIACCIASTTEAETECEDVTPEACTARGGMPAAAATCDPDPCAGGSGTSDGSNDATGDPAGDASGLS